MEKKQPVTAGKKIVITGLLDGGAVVIVILITNCEKMGFIKDDLINTKLLMAAANRGSIYVAKRNGTKVPLLEGKIFWLVFLLWRTRTITIHSY